MSPKSRVAMRHVNLIDRVREEIKTEPPRFVIIERVDKPTIPTMFSVRRIMRGECE